ncbi:VCBS repeat-containing protein [Aliikangiella marina]|uniref:VCBS repeat-containing protein n=1 Tax=Aliikangiella marina TaxID=1712262 RepID=A0A545TA90_9GAMM|nr:VCBS repeat-containing protein [Aliikangiella marina]
MTKNTKALLISVGLLNFISQANSLELANTTYSKTLLSIGAGQAAMTFCDFDADGNQDILIANYSDNNMVVLRGDGKGKVSELRRISVGENPTGIATADINGDGKVDVAIANHETSYVTLLFGDGDGNFQKLSGSQFELDISPHPHEVKLVDLDGDNKTDLIVDSRDDDGVRFYKGADNGGFVLPGKVVQSGGDPYRGFAIGDINNDGSPDLVTPNLTNVGVLLNTGNTALQFSLSKIAHSDSPFTVELADLNGDNNRDLIVASNNRLVAIYPGNGKGDFDTRNKIEIGLNIGAKQIAIGDINGDGIQDAILTNWAGELIAIMGSTSKIETILFHHPKISNPWGVLLADMNGDGHDDFIVADGRSNSAILYLSAIN